MAINYRTHIMETDVLIIGGGATGTGIARDLALRGVACILVEMRDINSGASGANHGLLHSGARYVSNDPEASRECAVEGTLLKKMAPQCIDNTGGLFVALAGDDESFIADFPNFCRAAGVPVKALDIRDAKEMEPALANNIIAAYAVEDASIDPFKLSLENMTDARKHGARLLRYTTATSFEIRGHRITTTSLVNTRTGEKFQIQAREIISASGAWAGIVAEMAGIAVPMLCSKGSLLVTHSRITERVINRLRKPSDADIVVPGGTVSIAGTTSVKVASPNKIRPTIDEVDHIVREAAQMLPVLETTRYIRAYCGVRPLMSSPGTGDGRAVSRGFILLDHSIDGVENLTSITGGKLTTYRLMAEKAVDLVCERLDVRQPCRTATQPLPEATAADWTEPGRSPKKWMENHDPNDLLLCECEMVPKSTVDILVKSIREQHHTPDLKTIGLRSRIGKGACQGTFCSTRLLAYLYDLGELAEDQGLYQLPEFLDERWRGQRCIFWGGQLIQAELQEALHSGLLNLEHYAPSQLPNGPGEDDD